METKYLNKVFDLTKGQVIAAFSAPTIFWFSKLNIAKGLLFIKQINEKNQIDFEGHLFVDQEEFEYAKLNSNNVIVHEWNETEIEKFIQSNNFKRIIVEREYCTIEQLQYLKSIFLDENTEYVYVDAQTFRLIKSFDEALNIRHATDIAYEALMIMEQEYLVPGVSEKELEDKLAYIARRRGGEIEGFAITVLGGLNSATSNAHSSKNLLYLGQLVTIDLSIKYNGYSTNVAKSFIVGGEDKSIDPKYQEMLENINLIYNNILDSIKPGITTNEINEMGNKLLTDKGLNNFTLNLFGNGVGVEYKELPKINSIQQQDIVLETGMVISLRPSIFIQGVGGVKMGYPILVTESKGLELIKVNIDESDFQQSI